MVDTHAHVSLCRPSVADLLAAAGAAGVNRVLTVGIDGPGNAEAVATAERHPEVYAAVGRHPNAAGGFDDAAAGRIAVAAEHPRVRAIGETGLDHYRDGAPRAEQRTAFAAQIEIAADIGLPLVIHVRDAQDSSEAVDEVFDTLDRRAAGVEVILHCFSAPQRVLDAADRGWYCSFAGNVTYPSAGALREAAERVPDDLLLVETDSPYLSPQGSRGKPNQPANVVETASLLADVRGVSAERLERTVEANAERVFGW